MADGNDDVLPTASSKEESAQNDLSTRSTSYHQSAKHNSTDIEQHNPIDTEEHKAMNMEEQLNLLLSRVESQEQEIKRLQDKSQPRGESNADVHSGDESSDVRFVTLQRPDRPDKIEERQGQQIVITFTEMMLQYLYSKDRDSTREGIIRFTFRGAGCAPIETTIPWTWIKSKSNQNVKFKLAHQQVVYCGAANDDAPLDVTVTIIELDEDEKKRFEKWSGILDTIGDTAGSAISGVIGTAASALANLASGVMDAIADSIDDDLELKFTAGLFKSEPLQSPKIAVSEPLQKTISVAPWPGEYKITRRSAKRSEARDNTKKCCGRDTCLGIFSYNTLFCSERVKIVKARKDTVDIELKFIVTYLNPNGTSKERLQGDENDGISPATGSDKKGVDTTPSSLTPKGRIPMLRVFITAITNLPNAMTISDYQLFFETAFGTGTAIQRFTFDARACASGFIDEIIGVDGALAYAGPANTAIPFSISANLVKKAVGDKIKELVKKTTKHVRTAAENIGGDTARNAIQEAAEHIEKYKSHYDKLMENPLTQKSTQAVAAQFLGATGCFETKSGALVLRQNAHQETELIFHMPETSNASGTIATALDTSVLEREQGKVFVLKLDLKHNTRDPLAGVDDTKIAESSIGITLHAQLY